MSVTTLMKQAGLGASVLLLSGAPTERTLKLLAVFEILKQPLDSLAFFP